jgi:hypothetical protein
MYPLESLADTLKSLHETYVDYLAGDITLDNVIDMQTNTTEQMRCIGYVGYIQPHIQLTNLSTLVKCCRRKSRHMASLLHWMLKVGINSQAVANALPREAIKNEIYVTNHTTPIEFLYALYAQLHTLMCDIYQKYRQQPQ